MGTRDKGETKVFEFQQFSESSHVIKNYNFGEFSEDEVLDAVEQQAHQQIIRQERDSANDSNFKISDDVQNLRGLRSQENQDYEDKIQKDLESRFSKVEEEAREKGFQEGVEAGTKQAYEEAMIKANEQISFMQEVIDSINTQKIQMLTDYKSNILNLVRQFTKWFTLKEVSEDHHYLERLLAKLIHGINTKSNLIVKVNKNDFDIIPEAIAKVESQIGQLQNTRVEIDQDMTERGIVIESENGIIDGSIHAQFQSFDKVFESVGLDGDN
jgi:flagellar assembly protein FliH